MALVEHDGGLCRADAEALADACHPAPIPEMEPADWCAWFRAEVDARPLGMGRTAAERRVWGAALNLWHALHGETPNPDRCAGCGEWMLDGPGMRLPDGAVVHFGNPDRLDCLILYGQAWHGRASAGLMALGLKRPQS